MSVDNKKNITAESIYTYLVVNLDTNQKKYLYDKEIKEAIKKILDKYPKNSMKSIYILLMKGGFVSYSYVTFWNRYQNLFKEFKQTKQKNIRSTKTTKMENEENKIFHIPNIKLE